MTATLPEPCLPEYYSREFELYETVYHSLVWDGKNKRWNGFVVIRNCRTEEETNVQFGDLTRYVPVFPGLEAAA